MRTSGAASGPLTSGLRALGPGPRPAPRRPAPLRPGRPLSEADMNLVGHTARRLPDDPVVLTLLGDASFPLTLAEPDLLLPADLVLAFLLHVEHAMHELRVLVELRPGFVCLVDRDRHVRPALNREPARLLAAAATAAVSSSGETGQLADRLPGETSAAEGVSDIRLRAFGGFLSNALRGRLHPALHRARRAADDRRAHGRDRAGQTDHRGHDEPLVLERRTDVRTCTSAVRTSWIKPSFAMLNTPLRSVDRPRQAADRALVRLRHEAEQEAPGSPSGLGLNRRTESRTATRRSPVVSSSQSTGGQVTIKGSVAETAGRRLAGESASRPRALLAASFAALGAGIGVYRFLRGGSS